MWSTTDKFLLRNFWELSRIYNFGAPIRDQRRNFGTGDVFKKTKNERDYVGRNHLFLHISAAMTLESGLIWKEQEQPLQRKRRNTRDMKEKKHTVTPEMKYFDIDEITTREDRARQRGEC